MVQKINVGILFGGKSSEHEVSRVSASSIIKNISKDKYEVYNIGITKSGEWFLFSGDISEISSGKWEENTGNKKAFIAPDTYNKGLTVIDDSGKAEFIKLDVVIPVLHGKNGEDGAIPALLQLANIPFVGCGMGAASACMDKVITNSVLTYHGIDKPKFNWFYFYDFQNDATKYIEKTEKIIKKYPMFVKPANAGSSVGISKANNREELIESVYIAAKEDNKILVEEGIDGQEVECAVLGNNELLASTVGEIAPSNDFYDYDAKYLSGSSELYIPAKISKDVAEKVREIAKKAYKVMGCSGLSRVDFFVEKGTNRVVLNEINTFPGFTDISMYPKLMEHSGIKFTELIDKLIALAMSRGN